MYGITIIHLFKRAIKFMIFCRRFFTLKLQCIVAAKSLRVSRSTPTQIPHAAICHVTEARYVRIARKGALVNLVALEKTCTPFPWWRVRHGARVSFIALLTTNVCGTDPWTLPRLTFFNIIIHMAPVWVFSTYPFPPSIPIVLPPKSSPDPSCPPGPIFVSFI